MANEKQRRRRAKEKRHAYDLVEIDAEGNETVITASELRADEPKQSKGKSKPAAKRGRRVPQPPSWNKVFKRAALFGPVFFVVVLLLGQASIASALINAAFLMLVFVPFSYFLDGLVWRQYVKRNPSAAKR